jgi:hypothetical protein
VADQVHQVGRVLAVVDGEAGVEADAAAYSRSRRAPMPWKVPDQASAAARSSRPGFVGAQMRSTRRVHLAGGAAREGQQQDAAGSAPQSTSCATRCASVLVLPDPAPAITSRGGDGHDQEACG